MENISIKIKTSSLQIIIRQYINLFSMIIITVLLVLEILLFILLQGKHTIICIIFPLLVSIVSLTEGYISEKVSTEIQDTSDDLEFYLTGKMTLKFFERIIKNIDKETYHICRGIDKNGYIKDWYIFNKDMSSNKFYSMENKPLLSSEKNDILDLLLWVEKNQRRSKNDGKYFKRYKEKNGTRV